MREYIKAIEEKYSREGDLSQEQIEWIQWAKDKADWYDPLIEKDDPLLGKFKPELIKPYNRSDISYNDYTMQDSDSYWRKPWYSRND